MTNKKLNLLKKQLAFHCSVCFTVYQLLEVQQNLKTKSDNKCLNNCLQRWQSLLITYCQEQIILDFTRKEEQKDKQNQDLTDWLRKINQPNNKQ